MEMISSKNQISDPAFNYLKKIDNHGWGVPPNPNPLNYTGIKHPAAINALSNLPDLVTNWSIATPIYQHGTQTSSPETCFLRSNQLGFSSPESPWSSIKNFTFGKPLIDFRGQKSSTKSSDSGDSRNQATQSVSMIETPLPPLSDMISFKCR